MKLLWFFLVLTSNFLFFRTIFEFFGPHRTKKQIYFLQITEEIIMSLKSGQSFQRACRSICDSNTAFAKLLQFSEEKTSSLDANQKQFIEIIRLCDVQSSLAYKILTAYRQRLRIQNRLNEKQKVFSAQPKAQAIVSVLLYLTIFVFQWRLHPDFLPSMHTNLGKSMIILSFILLFSGVYLVFSLSKPSNRGFL